MPRRLIVALLTLALWVAAPAVASAHPLGNFTVNHYSRIQPSGDQVRVVYVVDMAEIPAFQEKPRIQANPRGYAEELGAHLRLALDGQPVALRLEQASLSFPAGQGGLDTLRLEAVYSAELRAAGASVTLDYRDDNDPSRIGWREIVARPGSAGTTIQQASVPADDVTRELRQYPEDLLSSPLSVHEAHLAFTPGAAAPPLAPSPGELASDVTAAAEARPGAVASGASVADAPPPVADAGTSGVPARGRSMLADLANGGELTPAFLLFAVGVAIVLGAAHALQPGHGKTVVAAYLVGARGTARHALFLGATVTATHTAGVYALGLATLFLSQYVVPERLYPILEVVSGGLVLAIGAWLLAKRARILGRSILQRGLAHPHATWPGHSHSHDGDEHGDEHETVHAHGHEDGHSHAHDHGHDHDHGHEHAPPTSWRGLLALGISGGLLPCPEALMVLLITIAAHRVLFGLLLIVAFSTGLAGVLVGFGLLLVYARGLFARLNLSGGLAQRVLPVGSALVVVVAGLLITAQAVPQLAYQ